MSGFEVRRITEVLESHISTIRTPSDWLRYAQTNLGEPGAEPFVFVSWALADEKIVKKALPFIKARFKLLSCPATGRSYELRHFTDGVHGTAQGQNFPEEIARYMWKCRAAIIFWSIDLQSGYWGRELEIPSLVWRQNRHGLPLFIIHASPTDPLTQNVSIKIDGEEELALDLTTLTDDRNPRDNVGDAAGKYLPQLKNTAFKQRMVNVTVRYAEAVVKRWHLPPPIVPTLSLSTQHPPLPPAVKVFEPKWSGDFSSGQQWSVVYGREDERDQLGRYACDSEIGVVTITAIGGQGKTALVRDWIERTASKLHGLGFEGSFAFSFYHNHSQAEFAKELAAFLDPVASAPHPDVPPPTDLAEKLRRRKILLFLDGLEVIQTEERQNDRDAHISQGPVLNLLVSLCQDRAASQTVAVVTSRLRLLGFEEHENLGLRNIDLAGLSEEAGDALLIKCGVNWGVSDAQRKEFCRNLEGHPLLLRVFGDAVKREGGALTFGNVAQTIASEMRIAEPGEFADKLKRVISSYRERLGPLEQVIISAVAVFGGNTTSDQIKRYLRQRQELSSYYDTELVAKPIKELERAGILISREEGASRLYSCHPSLREGFAPDPAGVRLAARISLYSRPAPIRPRTIAEAEPYLNAISIHLDSGNFSEANKILARHLNFGDVFDGLYGGELALLDCLKGFLGPSRREACEKALGVDHMIAMIPRLVMAAIQLGEWDEASQYTELDTTNLNRAGKKADVLSIEMRAQIAAEIGEIDDARTLFQRAINLTPPRRRGFLWLMLAALERQAGDKRTMLGIISDWLSNPQDLDVWIAGWPEVLDMLQYGLKRSHPALAERCFAARAALMRAVSVRAPKLEELIQFQKIHLKLRRDTTLDDWRLVDKLASELEGSAKDQGLRAHGGWPMIHAQARNALGDPKEALLVARRTRSQFPIGSWRRLWFEVEIARSFFLQGQIDKGAEEAQRVMREAHSRSRELISLDAAELILEYADHIRKTSIIAEAQQTLNRLALQDLNDSEIPELGPLPGETGWDGRVTDYILRDLRPDRDEDSPQGEELDAALVRAAEVGSAEAILRLREIGASSQAKDAKGVSALSAAAAGGHVRALEALLRRTEPFNLESELDRDAVAEALRYNRIDALRTMLRSYKDKKKEVLNALLQAAASIGSGAAIEEVCKAGADPKALNGATHPFVRAARSGNLDAVVTLAKYIVDVNKAVDADGETALMAAAGGGYETVVSWLLEAGANIDAHDSAGRTASDYAIAAGQTGTLDVISETLRRDLLQNVDLIALATKAAANGQIEMLKRACERGARLNSADPRGHTPLIAAALAGRTETILAMRKLEPDLPIDARSPAGWTALMAAAAGGQKELVTILVKEFSASLEAVDSAGWSSLDHALASGEAEMLRLLLSLGAEVRYDDTTPVLVKLAAERSHRDALEVYLAALARAAGYDQLGVALELAPLPDDSAAAADLLITKSKLRETQGRIEMPTRPLGGLSEEELSAQPCIYLAASASSYGGLPVAPVPSAILELLTSPAVSACLTHGESFDFERVRVVETAWFGGIVAFLPQREGDFSVPLFISAESLQLAQRTNEWIYQRMKGRPAPQADDVLFAYVRFFFATVVGRLGAFRLAERLDSALWLPNAAEAIKREFTGKLQPLRLLTPNEDGRLRLRGTVVFKNALFVTSILVAKDWTTELIDEELLMEDLPIDVGQKRDLLVMQ